MNLLEMKELSISFGGLQALLNVNLTLEPGEIKGLIGPNGSGKTTIFNVITGIYKPNSGSIHYLGKDLLQYKSHQRSSLGISRTFQNLQLFTDMTVLENVMTGFHNICLQSIMAYAFQIKKTKSVEKKVRERAEELLQMIGMDAYADWPISELSFAQQRLVEIARSLAPEPKLLLLDEPASGIDLKMHNELKKVLRNLRDKQGVTIIHIEHIMSMVMDIADRVMVLYNGTPIFEGLPQEVQQHARVQEVYLGT